MKREMMLLLAALVLMLPLAAGAAANPWDRQLPFEEATITYALSGMETGREILYIREHGKETARYREASTSMLGMTMKNRTVEITTPEWVYAFDLEEGSGTKSVNPQKCMIEEYRKLSAADQEKVTENAEKMGMAMMGGLQGSVEQNAREIMGYSCDRATIMGATVYSIHETPIALLSESNMMGISAKSEAVSIDKNRVGDEHFRFPAGIEPQSDPEADDMARVMAAQTITMLKDPEAFKQSGQGSVLGIPQPRQQAIPPEEQQQMQEAMKTLKGLFGN